MLRVPDLVPSDECPKKDSNQRNVSRRSFVSYPPALVINICPWTEISQCYRRRYRSHGGLSCHILWFDP